MTYDLFTYPTTPGFKDTDTSLSAAQSMASTGIVHLNRWQLIRFRIGFEARLVARKLTRWQRRNAALRGAETRRHPNASGRSAKVWQVAG